jgi:purine catabolism regulator
MSMPTIASLCAAVPAALRPAPGFTVSDVEITAVHVSELLDPTDYLSGGELLLTTGLSMPDSAIGCQRYAARLRGSEVTALAVGLGPSLGSIPSALAHACHDNRVTLLVVPPEAAFLTVTKAYWTARSRFSQQAPSDAISAHRSLVDAIVSRDPVGATLKALSRAIGGWVATLSPSGGVEHVFPGARVADALTVADQITTMQMEGGFSSASFPLGDDVVAVFPLPLENRIVGYIAIGSAGAMDATARRLVLTAGALLSLNSVQRQRADAAVQARKQTVAILVDLGFIDAAERLLLRTNSSAIGGDVRVLVVRSTCPADIADAVGSWMPAALPGAVDQQAPWFILPQSQTDLLELESILSAADPASSAALSDIVELPLVHQIRVGLAERIAQLPDGSIEMPRTRLTSIGGLDEGVLRVLNHNRSDLTRTLVAYLRHRGQWELASREAGVHRNTMRLRLVTIERLLGADPADPDVAAHVWLYLRANGLA